MKRLIFLLATIIFIHHVTYSQKHVDRSPYSTRNNIDRSDIVEIEMPELNLDVRLAEDSLDMQNGVPPRFGFPHIVDYNLKNSGTWIDLPNGDRIWFLRIHCPHAKSINLLYDKFWLPENAELYIYSPDEKCRLRMFSSKNNRGPRDLEIGFATGLILDESIILEYYEPKSVLGQGLISISNVVHGYKSFGVESSSGYPEC